ncbi:MAG TPA: hypothetical protein PLO14_02080 [Accumulibacter sp.]|uniref:hypothetical protein n=1 Tax=Accumulibacter sp. TaxID=2053492 RepID=UPI0025FDACC2|nr:hypothetical protein [Accumulibacter sp.]MCM8599594.1 hypothetical protein [Accumulibacter sp.]MCM8663465.1 hypothetical protein [Accumulibacter sp.]HNC51017.1 hypothetical protein [Accumulibacter sp.]
MSAARGGRKRYAGALLGALAVLAAMPASGEERVSAENMFDGQWHLGVTPYAWLPTIYTSATLQPLGIAGGVQANMHSDPGTYLHNLSFAFFLAGEARKGEWSLLADYIYMKFDRQNSGVRPLNGGGGAVALPFDASMSLKSNVLTLAGSYTAWRRGASHLDILAGTRYLNMDATLDFSLLGITGGRDASASMNKWDAIVGLKGQVDLDAEAKWFVPYYLDVGGGSANTTWQALVGVGYRYGWGDLTLAVRNLSYNFTGRGGGVEPRFTGFALAATFPF